MIYLEGLDERLLVVDVSCYHLYSLGRECLCRVTVHVPSDAPDLPCSLFERGTNDGPALGSGRADNGKKLRHLAKVGLSQNS
jgi:hypothetical protein